jgi:hypothetical protein
MAEAMPGRSSRREAMMISIEGNAALIYKGPSLLTFAVSAVLQEKKTSMVCFCILIAASQGAHLVRWRSTQLDESRRCWTNPSEETVDIETVSPLTSVCFAT